MSWKQSGCSRYRLRTQISRKPCEYDLALYPHGLWKDLSSLWKGLDRLRNVLEATPGIEPGYADLQSATSPLRHVAYNSALG